MSKIALVFPYFRTRSPNEILFPPLGIAYITNQLRKLDIETKIFDCTFQTLKQIEKTLIDYQPDIVGIYSMITLSRNAIRIAEMVRANIPHSLIVAGGPMPTLYPQRYSGPYDLVFRGESDLSFPSFCHDYIYQKCTPGKLDGLLLDTYAGLYIRNDKMRVNNPTIHHKEDEINLFPLPERRDFDHHEYQEVWLKKDGTKTTSIITTLGCPYSCDFCSRPIFGNLFRRHHLDKVFEEIEQILCLGYDSLWIADDNFTLDMSYLTQFCQRIAGRNISWSCLSRVTGIDEQITGLMKEAGCRRVYIGLETGCQDTLQLMNKKTTLEEGVEAVQQFHKAGIEVAAFFIVGYPGETVSSIEETFKFALSLPLDDISFNVPFPLPGSPLFERVGKVDMDKDWIEENEVTFVYQSEFDPRWLRRRIKQTMKSFTEKM